MNVSFLIEDTITLKRRSAGSYSNTGVWSEGTLTTTSITACIQPQKEYIIDREGLKRLQNTGNINIFTTEILKVNDVGQSGDIVTWNGKDYEIMNREKWNGKTLNHYKYEGVLKNA